MKSIRLSLVLYFLALLAVALGAVSVFAYQATRRTLQAKEESTRSFLETQHENRCRAIQDELDQRVLRRAQTLARLAQSQWGPNRLQDLSLLGMLTAGVSGQGHLQAPFWIAQGTDNPLAHRLRRPAIIQIPFAEEMLPGDSDDATTEFFQVFDQGGRSLQRSHSLGESSFVLDREVKQSTGLYDYHFDDTELPDGLHVRRVTLKVPVTRFRFRWGQPPSRTYRPPTPSRSTPPAPTFPTGGFAEHKSPAIFIQCASDTSQRDLALAAAEAERDGAVAQLEAESHDVLRRLSNRLLTISVLTFLAGAGGGLGLVYLGLIPVRRLSDAVSQVSAKDFRLGCDPASLPRELQSIAERLTQTLELLRRAFAREKQAAADISHDLRTPLAALLTTTDVVLRKPRTPDEYRSALSDCREIGRQMSHLVERLLALAQLDAGVEVLRPRPTDVSLLAEQCANLVRPLADARGLSLEVQAPGPLSLAADADKLREVLLNLLHNAIHYNRPNGAVTLAVARNNGTLHLSVQDTGIGIAPEVHSQIFERFYRADPSRQADCLHAGLGLAIVKAYTDLMGGRVSVRSALGQGSTFNVDLPATPMADLSEHS